MAARHPLEDDADDFYAELERAAAEADTSAGATHPAQSAQRASYDGSIGSLHELMDQVREPGALLQH